MKTLPVAVALLTLSSPLPVMAKAVPDDTIYAQRALLAEHSHLTGPQSPRDINQFNGANPQYFGMAPSHTKMNLCNIHFHAGAEHKGGEFTRYAGNGDGKGYGTGFLYNGQLSDAQLRPVSGEVCPVKGHSLHPGDTIEVHYVFSSAPVMPGASLNACLSEQSMNPTLRVETQVMVLANDTQAANFTQLAAVSQQGTYAQAPNIPNDTGTPVVYAGSTTGPGFNESPSPLKVTWSVRPQVKVANINSVADWCDDNPFNEQGAHGVRNLVTNPELLSVIY